MSAEDEQVQAVEAVEAVGATEAADAPTTHVFFLKYREDIKRG